MVLVPSPSIKRAYDLLRDPGIALPTQCTLGDYRICCSSNGVLQGSSSDQQLLLASRALTCEEWRKYVYCVGGWNVCQVCWSWHSHMYSPWHTNWQAHRKPNRLHWPLRREQSPISFWAFNWQQSNMPAEPAMPMLPFMVKWLFTDLKFTYAQF